MVVIALLISVAIVAICVCCYGMNRRLWDKSNHNRID